ncbi:ABC transporter substrate-binding protein, partial [Marinobacter pelagius]|nr:ABC transporter substrate-binding protein [Marinobacter sp. C7]
MNSRLTLTLAATLLASTAMAQENELTVASWGGSFQEAESKALFEPAAEAMGIDLTQETYSGMSDVRLQVQTGQVAFDLVASGTGSAARAGAEGLLEPIDYDV